MKLIGSQSLPPIENLLLRISACSYEGSVFGWRVESDNITKKSLVANMHFGFNCSSGSLKCIAVSAQGKYLCAGGMEERIYLFNMLENRSMGELGLHEGAITCLSFFGDSHLISGSDVSFNKRKHIFTDVWCILICILIHILIAHMYCCLT